jgi:MFS family permease
VSNPGPRGFSLFWAGRAASQFGDEITILALPWLVAQETGSPLAVGLLEALVFVPALIVGLPIGAWADRRSRRRSMVEADLARLVLLASIPLAVMFGLDPRLGHVMVVAFLAGAARILFEASAQAFLPDLVPREGIVRANARLSLTEGVAAVIGPTTAGILIATVSASGAIAVDAVTFAVSAAALSLVWVAKESYGVVHERVRSAIKTGIRATVRNQYVRALTLTVGVGNVGSGIVIGMLPIFLQRTLGVEGWQAGIIYACNGLGAIAAAAIAPRLAARIGVARAVLVGFGCATLGFLFVSISTASTWFVTATLGDGLVGFGIVVNIISSASLRQRTVPPGFLARVTVSYRLAVNGAVALGAVIGGVVGEVIGVREAIVFGVAIYLMVAIGATQTCLNGPDPQGVVVTT